MSDAAVVVLVDANVILDIRTQDDVWFDWSTQALKQAAARHALAVNPIIYGEISVDAESVEALEEELPVSHYRRLPLPYEAGFFAGKAFVQYRRAGGARRSPLPDFYIGAHAAIDRLILLTRDASRYRSYFPTVELIAPDES